MFYNIFMECFHTLHAFANIFRSLVASRLVDGNNKRARSLRARERCSSRVKVVLCL